MYTRLACALVFLIAATVFFLFISNQEPQQAPSPESIKNDYVACLSAGSNEAIGECFEAFTARVYDTYPVAVIASELDTLLPFQKNKWCHEVMHYMGWKAYEQEKDVASAFMQASELCDSGMYHGIMEEYLRENGFGGNVEELIRDVCIDSLAEHPSLSEGSQGLCYHGLGHGLMYVTSSNLKETLDYCDTLDLGARGCYTGAFMEYRTSKELGPLENALPLDDFSHCEELSDLQKPVCFFAQGLNYLSLAGGEVKPAMEYCANVPEEYKVNCYVGVGANTPNPGRSHSESGRACTEAREVSFEAYTGCIKGGLMFVMQLERGNIQEAKSFCDASSDDVKLPCYEELGVEARPWLTKNETIEEKCEVISDTLFKATCVSGGTL